MANLREANAKVAALCHDSAAAAARAVDWIRDNGDKLRQEQTALAREFRKFTATARKLEAAVHRPMCVGVFGPSQAGKSYLISALARHGTEPLMAEFDGIQGGVDFVREINPEGGQESTGLVTRFTINRAPTPPGFPVALRLLSQTDIIRIIGNTYLSDVDLSEEEPPEQQAIRAVIDEVARAAAPSPVDTLTEDDVWELQEYFEKHFKGQALIKALGGSFWAEAATLAPRLPIAARARLFSLLWGEVEPFTRLFVRLYGALSDLGFATDAYCPIAALVPRDDSIIDVRTLAGLGGVPSGGLEILSSNGNRVTLARADITALIAELRITVRDKPWDFFDHTDLLDFPGARSRENIPAIRDFLQKPNSLEGLFLRGKVAYLFDRYCAEQELTSMLLCIGPSNQEVRTLPAMIKDWIDGTHGAEPVDRLQHQTALFLILTKFDAEFEEKAGQAESSEARWTVRLNTSLLDFFGKADPWPREWTPDQPFNNTFWLRNPNFKAKHILDYDAGGREAALRASEKDRIGQFREEYLANPDVLAHFADPARAWDEAFRLNDGGISYLAERLAPVCNPDIKRRQIEARISNLRRQMVDKLGRYYVSGDLDEILRKRRAAAHKVVKRLAMCIQSQRFGHLLREMQVTDTDLADLYYQVETRPNGDGAGPAPVHGAIGTPVDAGALLAEVFGEDLPVAEEEESTVVPAARDQADRFADAVVERWVDDLHIIADTPRIFGYFRMSEPAMADLVAELIAGAQRLELRDDIARQVRAVTSFRQKLDVAMAKPALVAADIVNGYVNCLGFDGIALEARPMAGQGEQRRPVFAPRPEQDGRLDLPAQQEPFDRTQYVDWMAAFVKLVEDNAASLGGRTIDVAQNSRLGDLLSSLEGAP